MINFQLWFKGESVRKFKVEERGNGRRVLEVGGVWQKYRFGDIVYVKRRWGIKGGKKGWFFLNDGV